jgi:hypothetical protein
MPNTCGYVLDSMLIRNTRRIGAHPFMGQALRRQRGNLFPGDDRS